MQAKNFRIGNYINYDGTIYGDPSGTKEIMEVNPLFLTNLIESETSSEDNWIEQFKRIALTEKWLFDFGFKKGTDGYFYKGEVVIYRRFSHFGLIQGAGGWREFNYVDELQNLFFALTGTELELKSKVSA